jgi:hypothetical protein
MQGEVDKYTPELQLMTLQEAEEKRDYMEQLLGELHEKWLKTIDEINAQTQEFMSSNEIDEFQARVNVLVGELNDKNSQIEKV